MCVGGGEVQQAIALKDFNTQPTHSENSKRALYPSGCPPIGDCHLLSPNSVRVPNGTDLRRFLINLANLARRGMIRENVLFLLKSVPFVRVPGIHPELPAPELSDLKESTNFRSLFNQASVMLAPVASTCSSLPNTPFFFNLISAFAASIRKSL